MAILCIPRRVPDVVPVIARKRGRLVYGYRACVLLNMLQVERCRHVFCTRAGALAFAQLRVAGRSTFGVNWRKLR